MMRKEWIGKRNKITIPLMIKDLENIDFSGLSGMPSPNGVRHLSFFVRGIDCTEGMLHCLSGRESKGGIYFPQNKYYDHWADEVLQVRLKIVRYHEEYPLIVNDGDYITLIFDGGQSLNVYLPLETPETGDYYYHLYIAKDGSTYYDDGLTQLAQSAPQKVYDVSLNVSRIPSGAVPGDEFTPQWSIYYRNIDRELTVFFRVIDLDTGEIIRDKYGGLMSRTYSLGPGHDNVASGRTVTMPNKIWNLRFEVGHEE